MIEIKALEKYSLSQKEKNEEAADKARMSGISYGGVAGMLGTVHSTNAPLIAATAGVGALAGGHFMRQRELQKQKKTK